MALTLACKGDLIDRKISKGGELNEEDGERSKKDCSVWTGDAAIGGESPA